MNPRGHQMRRGGLGGDSNPQRIDRAVSGPAHLTVLIFAACVVGVIHGLVLSTRAQLQDDRAVKVAFVFNLTKYVEWPHPSQELVVGVMGEGPMAEALPMLLAGRSSESRPIRVVVSPSDAQLETCHLLYIAYSSPKKVHTAIQRVRKMNILTVGDSGSFARDGGMVALVSTEDHIEIQVNLEATAKGHLKISSRLLELSTIVKTKAEGGN